MRSVVMAIFDFFFSELTNILTLPPSFALLTNERVIHSV